MAVRNLDALKAKLAAMPGAVRAEVSRAVDQNADDMVALAQRLAPKRTGALAASIHKESGDTDISTRVVVGEFYGRFVEFGTRSSVKDEPVEGGQKNRKAKRTSGGTRAQPFFWPAYRALKKTMKGRVTRGANKGLKAGS